MTPCIPQWRIAQSCIHSPSTPLLTRRWENSSGAQECKWEVTFSDEQNRRIVNALHWAAQGEKKSLQGPTQGHAVTENKNLPSYIVQ